MEVLDMGDLRQCVPHYHEVALPTNSDPRISRMQLTGLVSRLSWVEGQHGRPDNRFWAFGDVARDG
jgi:hypothetical protein